MSKALESLSGFCKVVMYETIILGILNFFGVRLINNLAAFFHLSTIGFFIIAGGALAMNLLTIVAVHACGRRC